MSVEGVTRSLQVVFHRERVTEFNVPSVGTSFLGSTGYSMDAIYGYDYRGRLNRQLDKSSWTKFLTIRYLEVCGSLGFSRDWSSSALPASRFGCHFRPRSEDADQFTTELLLWKPGKVLPVCRPLKTVTHKL